MERRCVCGGRSGIDPGRRTRGPQRQGDPGRIPAGSSAPGSPIGSGWARPFWCPNPWRWSTTKTNWWWSQTSGRPIAGAVQKSGAQLWRWGRWCRPGWYPRPPVQHPPLQRQYHRIVWRTTPHPPLQKLGGRCCQGPIGGWRRSRWHASQNPSGVSPGITRSGKSAVGSNSPA